MPQDFELGDDGEFAEPVDSRYGVYSARRGGWQMGRMWLFASLFACGIFTLGILLLLNWQL